MNYCKLMLLISLILTVGLANAAIITTTSYTCCNNFETTNGTLLQPFNDSTKWTYGGTNVTGSNDSSLNVLLNPYILNGQGVRIGSNSSNLVNMFINQNFYLSDYNNIEFWVYLDSLANTSNFQVVFSNNTAYTIKYTYQFDRSSLKEGWNKILISPKNDAPDGVIGGGMNITDQVIRIRINLQGSAYPATSNLTFTNMRTNITAKAKVIFVFDDGWEDAYFNAFPVMKANNQRGSTAVITNTTLSGGKDVNGSPGYMTLSELVDEQNNGWDAVSHGFDSTKLDTINNSAQISELDVSKAYLIANGFSKGANIFVLSQGGYNSSLNPGSNTSTLDLLKTRYLLTRSSIQSTTSTQGVQIQDFVEPTEFNFNNYLLPVLFVNAQSAESVYTNAINQTINKSGFLILSVHRVQTPTNFTNCSYCSTVGNFTNLSNFIASKSSQIDVITMGDLLITTTNTTFSSWSAIKNATGIDLTGLIIVAFLAILVILVVMGADLSSLEPTEIMMGAIVIIVIVFLISIVLGSLSTQF